MTEVAHGFGGYVRHRDRMVQESVLQDLKDTLIACRWLAGTTASPVADWYATPRNTWQVATTVTPLPLLDGYPINLIDYFPEAEDGGSPTPPNTFALDTGTSDDSVPVELGSNAEARSYVFNMAFYARSDGLALAVLNDLRDRYAGRLVRDDVIQLFDFNQEPPKPIVLMDVESFRFTVNTEAVAPHEVHLYFAELVLTDYVDPA